MDNLAKARAAKARAARHAEQQLAAEIDKLLANTAVNPELKRKLRYCQQQIATGRRDDLIIERRDTFIREAKRR